MALPKKRRSLPAGMTLSVVVHLAAGAGLYYALVLQQPPAIIAELDLSMIPLVRPVMAAQPEPPPPVPKPVQAPPSPKKESTPLPPKTEEAPPEPAPAPVVSEAVEEIEPEPAPAVTEAPAETAPEVAAAPSAAVPALEAVSDGAAVTVPSDTTDRYIPAAQAARQPRWVGNLIGPRDYPRMARQEGKDGKVLLTVFIDETGRVKDVRLLKGSYEILNTVALRKVREAIFTPAYNREGQPVPSKVTLPIRFQLEQ